MLSRPAYIPCGYHDNATEKGAIVNSVPARGGSADQRLRRRGSWFGGAAREVQTAEWVNANHQPPGGTRTRVGEKRTHV